MFDFANSSYTPIVVTVAFGNYFTQLVAPGGSGDRLWGIAIALSNGLVMLLSVVDVAAGRRAADEWDLRERQAERAVSGATSP